MSYFVMSCEGVAKATRIAKSPNLAGGPWMHGRPLRNPPPNPMIFELDPNYPGELKAMYKNKYPVMRHDLAKALQEAGVDNLQLFPAIVRDTVNKADHANYFAFNIVGVVSCASERSEVMGTSNSTMIDVDFQSLVIDETKTGGALLFRLAESVSAIVVHEKIKKHVLEQGIPYMVFYGPGEWAG